MYSQFHSLPLITELSLTKTQAKKLVAILEDTWGMYAEYSDWLGGAQGMVDFFTGEMKFLEEFGENVDYLDEAAVQAGLIAVKAEGFVTWGDVVNGTAPYDAWTHSFVNGVYTKAEGTLRQMANGQIPVGSRKTRQRLAHCA